MPKEQPDLCPHCNGDGYRFVCRVNPFAVKRPWENSEKKTCRFCYGTGLRNKLND